MANRVAVLAKHLASDEQGDVEAHIRRRNTSTRAVPLPPQVLPLPPPPPPPSSGQPARVKGRELCAFVSFKCLCSRRWSLS